MPSHGRFLRGVLLPAEDRTFFTWDFPLRRSPNRPWRRWGTDGLVRTTLRVLDGYGAAHRGAPRVTIGDLSRPRGGPFGPEYGFPGHASHQSGLDVDIYYPRRDRRERAAATVAQVDRPLSRDFVNRFVSVGAEQVYVGRRVGLRGPRGVVVPLWRYHENHMHVRLRAGGAACRTSPGQRIPPSAPRDTARAPGCGAAGGGTVEAQERAPGMDLRAR